MLRNTSCEQLDFFQCIEYHKIPKNNILLQIDILEILKRLGAAAYIPISHSTYRIDEKLFKYNKDSDSWTCINGNESGTGKKREKSGRSFITYQFEKECCRNCPHRQECMGNTKLIAKRLDVGTSTPELYEHSQFTKNEEFQERYRIRTTIEPKNSEMKRFHGLGRANGYGLRSRTVPCLP